MPFSRPPHDRRRDKILSIGPASRFRLRVAHSARALVLPLMLVACATLAAPGPAPSATEERPAGPLRIEGRVTSGAGAPVGGASVLLVAPGGAWTARTDAEGRFRFDVNSPCEITLTIEAEGFSTLSRTLRIERNSQPVLVLSRPGFLEKVNVAASRLPARADQTASSVSVLGGEELSSSGALRIDDILRQVPGFTLFRRSGSRTANPTAQGVFLRGMGGSGASRALVLDDGIPLNDPFGGWVAWGRVPLMALDRVEVLQGGASHLYGSSAVAGVINLVRREEGSPALAFESSYGSQDTSAASLYAGGRTGSWGGSVSGESFHTRGYVPVAPEERGEVDTRAGSRDHALELTGERWFSSGGRLFLRGSYFDESRWNGTRLQTNDTVLRQASLGWDQGSDGSGLSVRAYGSRQTYDQTFSAIPTTDPARQTEILTNEQEVPSSAAGLDAQWSRRLGSGNLFLAGVDLRRVNGTSDERIHSGGTILPRSAGGRQQDAAAFVEDVVSLGTRLSLTAGARLDRWSNFDGQRTSGGATTSFADRREQAFSPRISLMARVSPVVSLGGSVYRSFRAPTLNELYRSFRVGNVFTEANERLKAERAAGAEAGTYLRSPAGAFSVRSTLFWMVVDDPVANVTVSSTPSLITRQRRNLGSLRSRGMEVEAAARIDGPGGPWSLSAGYLLADSTVRSFPADRTLEGLRVPQVPRHQISLQLRHTGPRLGTAGVQARWGSEQFDDDRNELPLDSFLVVDALFSHPVRRAPLDLYVAGENVFDARYAVGRTPVRTLGSPRTVRAGIRLQLP